MEPITPSYRQQRAQLRLEVLPPYHLIISLACQLTQMKTSKQAIKEYLLRLKAFLSHLCLKARILWI